MEVLLEYRGSRRQITVSSGESLTECVTAELRRLGRSAASVHTANTDLQSTEERDVYILQKWSPQWDSYIDVRLIHEVEDGDRLSVVAKPKPPSKVLLYSIFNPFIVTSICNFIQLHYCYCLYSCLTGCVAVLLNSTLEQ